MLLKPARSHVQEKPDHVPTHPEATPGSIKCNEMSLIEGRMAGRRQERISNLGHVGVGVIFFHILSIQTKVLA